MDWKRRYEDSLLIVLETKNEYDFLCNQHHDLILLVQLMKETLSNLERLLHTCSPEDYDAVDQQYHLLFDEWNLNSSMVERLTGNCYREMINASTYSAIMFHRYKIEMDESTP